MTSNHHAPYDQGYTRAWRSQSEANPRGQTTKSRPSSDCGLQPDYTAGIASNRESECRGEYVPGSWHTARHTMGSRKCPKPVTQPLGGAVEGGAGNWGEVVTR